MKTTKKENCVYTIIDLFDGINGCNECWIANYKSKKSALKKFTQLVKGDKFYDRDDGNIKMVKATDKNIPEYFEDLLFNGCYIDVFRAKEMTTDRIFIRGEKVRPSCKPIKNAGDFTEMYD